MGSEYTNGNEALVRKRLAGQIFTCKPIANPNRWWKGLRGYNTKAADLSPFLIHPFDSVLLDEHSTHYSNTVYWRERVYVLTQNVGVSFLEWVSEERSPPLSIASKIISLVTGPTPVDVTFDTASTTMSTKGVLHAIALSASLRSILR